jgi:parallel beta-helix repeat protein
MTRATKVILTSVALVSLAGAAALIAAGPLNPPSGTVTSTGKTLSEIEPRIAINASNTPGDSSATYVISQPGSYYLTGNLAVSKSVGISIRASNVTLDLNGFTISKASGASSQSGVQCFTDGQDTYSDVRVRNGSVAGSFSDSCVSIDTRGAVVEDVRVSGAINDGGIVVSYDGVVRRCFARSCSTGILGGSRSVIENCVVTDCSSIGISLGNGVVRDCLATECGGYGIYCSGNGVVERNTLRDNFPSGGIGIYVTGVGARIEGNTVSGSYYGIFLGTTATDNLIVRNCVRKGGGSAFGMNGQTTGNYPNNHVAAIVVDPASPFTTTNPMANFQY